MKNFKYFENETAYNSERNGNYEEPWVSWTVGKGVNYNKKKYEPLTFKILSDGNIGWKAYNSSSARTIQYSKNGGEWLGIKSTTQGATIDVVTGDVLRFKGSVFPGSTYNDYSQFTSTCTFEAFGNPGSLKYGEVTYGDEPLATGCYYYLFKDCTGLISAPELPSTTLVNDCYIGMFYGCTNLTTAPELPATTLTKNCYSSMFFSCASLTTVPKLPATTLESGCYFNMFNRCSSLVHAPELPATILTSSCYYQMFLLCTSLISAPELPATTLASSCYYSMFSSCTSLITPPSILPATTLVSDCYQSMFNGCTSLKTAPVLPATTLVSYCYYNMFSGCTSLNYIKAMFTTTPSSTYTGYWVNNVSSTGTFVKNSAAQWDLTGASGIPSGWTVQTASS